MLFITLNTEVLKVSKPQIKPSKASQAVRQSDLQELFEIQFNPKGQVVESLASWRVLEVNGLAML